MLIRILAKNSICSLTCVCASEIPKMNEFPLLLYLKIFDFLDLSDLLTMRLVCKSFESAVREFRIQELTFLGDSFQSNLFRFAHDWLSPDWFSSDEPKELRMVFRFSKYFLSGSPFNVQFLKRLKIFSLERTKIIDLEEISRFQHLECLEIGFDLENFCESFCLSLPNLQALSIFTYRQKENLEMLTPKLRALELPDHLANSSLTFSHPESVQLLSIAGEFLSQNFINQFENVECLNVRLSQEAGQRDSDVRLDAILLKFPSLKRMHCNAKIEDGYIQRALVDRLLAQLKALKSQLKVYCTDIELPILIEDFEKCRKTYKKKKKKNTIWAPRLNGKLILQLKHYSKLNDNVRSTQWIDYNELETWLGSMQVEQHPVLDRADPMPSSLLPLDFFERFRNVRGIRVTSRIDEQDAFATFVKNCKKLNELSLSDSQLGQAFFDELPAMSSLNFLDIKESNELNMDFLLKMNQVTELKTNQQLTAKIVLKFFRSRFGDYLLGQIGSNSAEIYKNEKENYKSEKENLYSLKVCEVERQLNLESLIEHYNCLENC